MKLPHQTMFEHIKKKFSDQIWALELASDIDGFQYWIAFINDKKSVDKLNKKGHKTKDERPILARHVAPPQISQNS